MTIPVGTLCLITLGEIVRETPEIAGHQCTILDAPFVNRLVYDINTGRWDGPYSLIYHVDIPALGCPSKGTWFALTPSDLLPIPPNAQIKHEERERETA